MPRICDSLGNPHDFCLEHFYTEDEAFTVFSQLGHGPDGRGNCWAYNPEHPDYSSGDYQCEECHRVLTSEDN